MISKAHGKMLRRLGLAAAIAGLVPTIGAAQTPGGAELGSLSLEELLKLTVVSSASKFPQEIREAPASITVLRADEIRRFGYRTLGEALRSVRGFYTTYDRNYSYVGLRGFARPGDYNTRFLLLLDGQRLNDGTYDMAPIGTDFPVDLSLIDRIEIIRGPGSSLYGSSAFFAVVNVITVPPRRQGFQVEVAGGTLETRAATGTVTQQFSGGRALTLSGSLYGSAGERRLEYPEFADTPSGGVVNGQDGDNAQSVFGAFSAGHLTLHGGFRNRTKEIPTASYASVFADPHEMTDDDRTFLNGSYERQLGRGWLATGRLAYDQYYYRGTYPDAGDGTFVNLVDDGATTKTITGEVNARRRFGRAHQFTAGTEVRWLTESRQWGSDAYGPTFQVDAPGANAGIYLQDEARLKSWLIANVGLRVDHYASFGARATPRVALVWLPRHQTAVKLLYGNAFRAPNPFELNAAWEPDGVSLKPERIRSSEVVWEEFLTDRLRMTVSYFDYDANDIIEQRSINDDNDNLYYVNSEHLHGRGIESEFEAKLASGLTARVSHAYSHVRNMDGSGRLSNSPEQLFKLGVQVPAFTWTAAVEGQYVTQRLALDKTAVDGFFLSNLVATSPFEHRVAFTVGVYNLFDQHYADPGAEEHLQRAIGQDGRTALARLRLMF